MSAQTVPVSGKVDRYVPNVIRRKRNSAMWKWIYFGATAVAMVILVVLLWSFLRPGIPWLDWNLIANAPSTQTRRLATMGINSAIWGTLWITLGAGFVSLIIGLGTAIYLVEYAPQNKLTRFLHTNISNLAGVPSVVYGLLGLVLFVEWLNMGRTLIAGVLTMGLLILPVVVISSMEALRAVPSSLRQASYGLGATKWQTVRNHVLPAAFPGILTGLILSMSRAVGETAPIVVVGAASLALNAPDGPLSRYTTIPMQIYKWTSFPGPDWQGKTSAAIIVLLAVLIVMNSIAIGLREYFGKKARW